MAVQLYTHAIDDNGEPLQLRVKDGLIDAIGTALSAPEDAEYIDLAGQLVVPAFVDGHIHLDKSFLGEPWHPHQKAADLRQRLAIEKAALAKASPIEQRAEALLQAAVSHGTGHLRSHVDVDATTGLDNLRAVMAVRERWQDKVSMQLVAFPQAGVMSCPGSINVLEEAARIGVDAMGGIDPTTFDGDAKGQLDAIFSLAVKYEMSVDIHLHEPGDTGIKELKRIAEYTQANGLQGKVTVSHAYALGDVDDRTLDNTAQQLAKANIAIMTNAPGDRAFPPVARLVQQGVRVFAGNDNIQDAWWPYGNGDMLQRAMLVGYCSGFNTDEALRLAYEMITQRAADVLGLDYYGLHVGNPASFVAIPAPTVAAAVAIQPYNRQVVLHGQHYKA